MNQSLHQLTNPGLGRPTDLWVTSTGELPPQRSDQWALGYIHNLRFMNHAYSINGEVYYKTMNNIITYQNGYSSHNYTGAGSQVASENWQEILTQGTGKSYGFELQVKKMTGYLKGWLSYTLSKTTNQFNDLNNGEPFPSRFDRPHNISLYTNFEMANDWSFQLTWDYATGRPLTLPEFYYMPPDFNYSNGSVESKYYKGIMFHSGKRNADRMKDFHRLNFSFTKHYDYKWGSGDLTMGVYNAYNRRNPYYYYVGRDYTDYQGGIQNSKISPKLKSVSLFPIIPSVSYKISF